MRRALKIILIPILIACFAFSAYKVWEIVSEYDKADDIKAEMIEHYKPTMRPAAAETPSPDDNTPAPDTPAPVSIGNPKILAAQREQNEDIVGWVTIHGTSIDYLFVQTSDNDFYLKRDLNKNHAAAGTIFMDSRSSSDFSDFNTILYGHHMKNGSMFHDIKRFDDSKVFDTYQKGAIYLADKTFTLHIFAYLVIKSNDTMVYGTLNLYEEGEAEAFFDYMKGKARHYRDLDLTPDDQVVTLSTCAYEFEDARMILLAKLEEEYQ
ncbi:MAG: class B sortase [Oscillospiraceae bacterium]|nr:class B sortase [Oscillospiraceae bacterium]